MRLAFRLLAGLTLLVAIAAPSLADRAAAHPPSTAGRLSGVEAPVPDPHPEGAGPAQPIAAPGAPAGDTGRGLVAANTPHIVAAPAESGLTPLIALAALATGLGLARPRRALALTLALLLGLLAFETGLHSVHHIGQPDQGAACAVASAAPNLAATDIGPMAEIAAPPPMVRRLLESEPRGPRALAARSNDGRAPPGPLS